MMIIRKGNSNDITLCKRLADANREALGFVMRAKFEDAAKAGFLLVAETDQNIVGFVIYRHRQQDKQTTLYDLCVAESWRRRGIARSLLMTLKAEASQRQRTCIKLKCPVGLEANDFYERVGFAQIGIQTGKKRNLNIWQLSL